MVTDSLPPHDPPSSPENITDHQYRKLKRNLKECLEVKPFILSKWLNPTVRYCTNMTGPLVYLQLPLVSIYICCRVKKRVYVCEFFFPCVLADLTLRSTRESLKI
jgi:hypothetical protein